MRARLAIALRLFTSYCEQRRLVHPEIARYLEHMWRFIGMPGSSEAFGQWTADEPPLVQAGLGWEYSPGFEDFLAKRDVAEREFRQALCLATEVLFTSLYGAADDPRSRQFVEELAGLVMPLGVGFPDTEQFARSRWSDGCGWGEIPSTEQLSVWRRQPSAIQSAQAEAAD